MIRVKQSTTTPTRLQCCRESRAMNIQQHGGFFVAGLTARTNNAHEMSGKGKIGNVWQAFPAAESGRQDTRTESASISSPSTPTTRPTTPATTPIFWTPRPRPPKPCQQTLPSNTFLPAVTPYSPPTAARSCRSSRRYGNASGLCPPNELGGTRAFKTDYEIYDQRAADPENAQIDVYIGLR